MKKLIMILVVLALSGIGSFISAGMHAGTSESHATHLKYYITAQEALAADDFANAKKAIQTLAKNSEGEFKTLLETAAEADNIKLMRKEFKTISAKIAEMGVPGDYSVAYCPMADNNTGAYWVQKKGKIMNPYLGSAMLHCGSFKNYPGNTEHKNKHQHQH